MQSIDPELLTWLFIGAAGLAFGAFALGRAISRRGDVERLLRSGDRAGEERPRRERIAARPARTAKPVAAAEPEPRLPEHGPGRPAVLMLGAAAGARLMVQRAADAECREGLEAVAELLDDPASRAAAEALALRAAALDWSPEGALAHDDYALCRIGEAPGADEPLVLSALGRSGLPMGAAAPWEGPADLAARVEAAFAALHRPDAEIPRDLARCREEMAEIAGRLAALKLPGDAAERAAFWRDAAAALAALEAGSDEAAVAAFARSAEERADQLDAEIAGLAAGVKTLEDAEAALARAGAAFLEREAAVAALRAVAALTVAASADYARGVHCASRASRRVAEFPESRPLADAVRALALREAEAAGRIMTPQALDLLARVRRGAEALDRARDEARASLLADARKLQADVDRRLLAEHPVDRLMLCVREGGAFFARPR